MTPEPGALRALYLAFYFPPTGGGGIERTLSFLRHLPSFGIDCEVLAPTDARWLATDPEALARIPAGLRVHRTAYRGPDKRILPRDRLAAVTGRAPRLALRARQAPMRLLVPDSEIVWAVDAVPAALKLLATGRFDVLLSTAPPHSTTVIAASIARRSGVPWVADWRDPWLSHPDLRVSSPLVRAKLRAAAALARRSARAMDGCVCVSYARDEIAALAPDVPIAVVDNGVDLDDIPPPASRPPDGRFIITFSGYFFGDRGPGVFLAALAALLARRPELADVVRCRFIGGFRSADRAIVERLALDPVVAIEGTQPRPAALLAQRDADCLLLFMQDGDGRGADFVPAKTWEYLAARRPVLALVPPTGAAAVELARAGGAEVVAPDDEAGCAAALERLIDAWRDGRVVVPEPAPEVFERVARRTGARTLAAVVRDAVARRAV